MNFYRKGSEEAELLEFEREKDANRVFDIDVGDSNLDKRRFTQQLQIRKRKWLEAKCRLQRLELDKCMNEKWQFMCMSELKAYAQCQKEAEDEFTRIRTQKAIELMNVDPPIEPKEIK